MKNKNAIMWFIFLLVLGGIAFFVLKSINDFKNNNFDVNNLYLENNKENITKNKNFILVHFICEDNKFIDASFENGSISLAYIKLSDGREYNLSQVISASGARYANTDESFVFWNKGDTAFTEEEGKISWNNCIEEEKQKIENDYTIVGGDKDIHNCIGSAGYSYCEAKDKCIRPWEEECEKINNEKIILDSINKKISCEKNGGVYYDESKVCEINSLSEENCIAKGGEFNPCASACRHDPKAEMCTLQCVLTCSFK